MSVFWLLLLFVILFVVGTATALNYFGQPPKGKPPTQRPEDRE